MARFSEKEERLKQCIHENNTEEAIQILLEKNSSENRSGVSYMMFLPVGNPLRQSLPHFPIRALDWVGIVDPSHTNFLDTEISIGYELA